MGKNEYKGYSVFPGFYGCIVWKSGWSRGKQFATEEEAMEWIDEEEEKK